jgi:hypothetical protein
VCSVNAVEKEKLESTGTGLLEPDEIVVCNDAAKKMLSLTDANENLRLQEMAAANAPLFQKKRLL